MTAQDFLCKAHINKTLYWLHCLCNQKWTLFFPHVNASVAATATSSPRGNRECPSPASHNATAKRAAQSKSRNLLDRLRDYETETLRFMTDPLVPFTNNQCESDLRITKVQQKISGCFRSFEGAQIFCRVRSYLSTCRKHDIQATEALQALFDGRLSEIISRLE